MLDILLVLLITSGGFEFSCQHGEVCTAHTLTWDETPQDDEILYWTLYWKVTNQLGDPTAWMPTVDTCLAQPCQVYIIDPDLFPKKIIFFSLTATNVAGESPH